MMRRLTVGLVCALLIAVAVGWAGVRADDPPLALRLEADGGVCTAGSLTEVRWEVSGGVEPYEVMLDGEVVDGGSGRATVVCGPVSDVPEWLLEIASLWGRRIPVSVSVVDAAGEMVREELELQPARAVGAPTAYVNAAWGGGLTQQRTALQVSVRRFDEAAESERRYVVRWREVGAADWEYDEFRRPDSSKEHWGDWQHDTGVTGVRFEVEVARVRSFAERAMPGLLNWSDAVYGTTDSAPLDLIAQVTHDTITLSWGPNVEGLVWEASVSRASPTYHSYRSRWRWEERLIVGGPPYSTTYDGLVPDTLYDVRVGLPDPIYGTVAGTVALMSVRTEPAPVGWSREPRRPQNVKVGARDGKIVVVWEPPLEGEERAYEVYVREYGAPRAEPIDAAAGEWRVFAEGRSPETTYEVIVRHVGIEDEDTRVVREPAPPGYERTNHMTLPEWYVVYRGWGDWGGYGYAVWWDATRGGNDVQVQWRKDGYTMTRSAEAPPIVVRMAEPEPYPFRLRVRRGEEWSQWSRFVRAAVRPPSPANVEVRERRGVLMVRWDDARAGHLGRQIDGYRVYVHRAGQAERVQDVGLKTSAMFPIAEDGATYEVQVASYSVRLGENSGAGQTFVQGSDPTLWIGDGSTHPHIYAAWGRCDPFRKIPGVFVWTVRGGAAPFVVKLGNQTEFTTDETSGYGELRCDAEDAGGELEIGAEVVDAYGRSDTGTVRYSAVDLPGDDDHKTLSQGEWMDPRARLSPYLSVQTDSLWLSWPWYAVWLGDMPSRVPGSPVVRWRESGNAAWSYRLIDDVQHIDATGVRWQLSGLEPATTYEVQLAFYWSMSELDDPDQLPWGRLLTATTLPVRIDADVRLAGSDVVVSWAAIAGAWGYQVAVRADGVGWWRAYEPEGGAVEFVVFRGLAAEADVEWEAEVITPPWWQGEEQRRPGFDPVERCCE